MSSAEVLCEGRFVRLVRDGHWEYVERVRARGAVFVIACTAADELVLVEQHRIPVGARTLELPAGIFGDEESGDHETPEACALRELEEETGYRGAEAQLLLTGPVAPGLTNERMYLIRVRGLERVHEGGGVGGEQIRVHTMPLADPRRWLAAREEAGLLIEPRIYAALYLLERDVRQRAGSERF